MFTSLTLSLTVAGVDRSRLTCFSWAVPYNTPSSLCHWDKGKYRQKLRYVHFIHLEFDCGRRGQELTFVFLIDVLQPQQVDGAVVVAAVVHGQHLHVGRQRLPEKRSLENKMNIQYQAGSTTKRFLSCAMKIFLENKIILF